MGEVVHEMTQMVLRSLETQLLWRNVGYHVDVLKRKFLVLPKTKNKYPRSMTPPNVTKALFAVE